MAKRISRAAARAAGFKSATEAMMVLDADRKILKQLQKNELKFKSKWAFNDLGDIAELGERIITVADLKAAYEAGLRAGQLQNFTKTQFREQLKRSFAANTPQTNAVAKLDNKQKGEAIKALWLNGKHIGELENYVAFLNANYEEDEDDLDVSNDTFDMNEDYLF
ncbi:MAG: hypothetical protein J6S85_25945 [Methanobrevibacter sp.]|nr:hypothetical protein [Methanobrevibacter sp.]